MEIQHPLPGAIMPANMPAPVVLWKTNLPGVSASSARFAAPSRTGSFEGVQPMWRPPETEWRQIKQAASGQPL